MARKIRRARRSSVLINLQRANQRVQKADIMDINKLAVRPASAKSHAAKPSELRNARPIMIFLFRRRNSDLLTALRNEKASLPMEPTPFSKNEAIAILRGIAANSPEDTRGDLSAQIRACQMMYCTLGHKPALQRLNEIANVEAVRTKGRRKDQERAMNLLKSFLSSMEVDGKQGIQ
jgi:hypothetical protein